MTIRCFLLSATVYVITVCLLYAVNINAKDVESFQTEGSTRAIRSLSTSDFHFPITCTGNITFGNSVVSIIPDYEEWENAKENCICLGGKLLELETSEENEFIKDTVRTLNTGVSGYWIGGYNLHNDGDFEWLSKPNQAMPFSDWDMETYPQPQGTADQRCMVIWRNFDFRWGDYYCTTRLSYICEFEHQ
ncbi:CLEC3A [Mytilus edulis]|uniref:CLEC3A n=1 Tax=Mytilus edulis TaxID=6550 RepID=A0A8S3QWW1_MYTED|nr:CLEC3A [Mytilus edulis]